jgi:hypothetical protein
MRSGAVRAGDFRGFCRDGTPHNSEGVRRGAALVAGRRGPVSGTR